MTKQSILQTNYSGKAQLFDSEKYLKNYNKYIIKIISSFYDNSKHFKVLEFGAGIGTLTRLFAKYNRNKPDCIEIDKSLITELKSYKFKVYKTLTGNHFKKYDFIYSSNVLEHIKNDIATLKSINKIMSKESRFVLYVPAFMFLYSGMDKSVGHFRRYGKKELYTKLDKSGFEIIHSRYVDSLGFFCLIIVKLFGYGDVGKLDNERNLKVYDNYLFPLSVFLDKYLKLNLFFGKNLFIVCRVK